MRSATYGMVRDRLKTVSVEQTLEMFRKMCCSRFFELNVKRAYDVGKIKMPIYLSVGQEAISAALAVSYRNPAIFAQHRCHDVYLAYGGDVQALIDELLHRFTGCAHGMGGSASIHDPKIKMFGHDGLMGTQIPIAVGYAAASMTRTLAIMGDASAEEDYVLAAFSFAVKKKAPILFVCEDNGLSILTPVAARRDWQLASVARSFGMPAVEITDDPWLIMHWVRILQQGFSALLNIHTVRHLWHAGTGRDSEPEWDRFELVKEELRNMGLRHKVSAIEEKTREYVDALWAPEFGGESV